jgi:hypothetical protein
MILSVIILAIVALCSVPCWLAWKQTMANYQVNKQVLWALDDLKTLIVSREHEAGYVEGTSTERGIAAERAADLAAVAVTAAAHAVLAAQSSDVYDPDDQLVARIKPTSEGKEGAGAT